MNHHESLVKARQAAIGARKSRADAWAVKIAPVIAEIQAGGITSIVAIARALNERGIPSRRQSLWTHRKVAKVMARVGPAADPQSIKRTEE